MNQPPRLTFTLLRMLLSMAAIGAVLAVGRWRDAHLAPIIVAAAAAGLLMFVIQWRHWDVLLAETLAFLNGAMMGLCLSASPGPEQDQITGPIVGGLLGWFVVAVAIRLLFPRERAEISGNGPESDEIESVVWRRRKPLPR